MLNPESVPLFTCVVVVVFFNSRTFNMDEFKREYSNKDTLTEALPYFWKNFDKENFSIWFCEYKYNDELARIFMTSNLIRGEFIQEKLFTMYDVQ